MGYRQKTAMGPRMISVIILFSVILGVILYILPTQDSYDQLTLDADSLMLEVEQLETEFDELQEIKKSLGPEGTSDAGIEQALAEIPVDMEQNVILTDLNDVAEANSINYDAINFTVRENVTAGVNALGITASFEGDYDDLRNFLKALEVSKRKFIVNSISVQFGELITQGGDNEDGPFEDEVITKQPAVFTLILDAFFQG